MICARFTRPGLALLLLTLGLGACLTPQRTAPSASSEWAGIGGYRNYYVDLGDKTSETALVLVHGWAADHSFWRAQLPDLVEDVDRLLAVDLLGHGRSEAPDIEYSIDDLAHSVLAVMDDADVQTAVLVGHSNGVPVVRHCLRLAPERVSALIIIEGSFLNQLDATNEAAIEQARATLRGPDWKSFVQAQAKGIIGGKRNPGLAESLRQVMLDTPQHVLVRTFDAAWDPAANTADPLDVPVLGLGASYWSQMPGDPVGRMRQLAPELEWHTVKNVGHLLMLDDPVSTRAEIIAFLDECGLP